MAITRKQLMQCSGIIYLILVTALSGYITSRSIQLSLPIPRGLTYSTTILPLCSALLLELSNTLTQRQERRKQQPLENSTYSPLIITANIVVVIYSTVLVTLLGTHLAPSPELNCGLREHWTSLFQQKNEVIRTIQDNLQCCGFQNPRDMPWPFPDKDHRVDACSTGSDRTEGCLNGWKDEERRLAGILIAVIGLVSLWQLCSILIKIREEPWLHQIIPRRISRIIASKGDSSTESLRRRISYTAAFDPYSDGNDGNNHNNGTTGRSRRMLDGEAHQAISSPNNETHYEDQERPVGSGV